MPCSMPSLREFRRLFVADLVSDENRGTAFGLFNFSIGLGALPASMILVFSLQLL